MYKIGRFFYKIFIAFLVIVFVGLVLVHIIPDAFAQSYDPDFLVGGTPTCQHSHPSFPCSNAVDDNTGTIWDNNNNEPSWFKYDLGASTTKTLNKFRAFSFADGNGQAFKDFSVDGSDDDTVWINVIATTTAPDFTPVSTFHEFIDNDNTAVYRYYRVNLINDYRGGDNVKAFWEFEMMELAVVATTTDDTTNIEIGLLVLLFFSLFGFFVRMFRE